MLIRYIVAVFVVVVVIVAPAAAAQRCTYTAAGWANRSDTLSISSGGGDGDINGTTAEETPDTTCGVPWGPLLRKQPTRLIVADNVPWLLGAQTYISAALNWRRFAGVETLALYVDTTTTGATNLTLDLALLALGDSLERVCDDVSQWSLAAPLLAQAMRLLDSFNHGQLPDAPSCADEFSAITVDWALATHYYVNGNDVLIIRDPATNLTARSSLLDGIYATQYGLYTSGAVLFIACLLLGIKLVLVLRDKHHQYSFTNKRGDPDHDAGDDFELQVRADTSLDGVHTSINGNGKDISDDELSL